MRQREGADTEFPRAVFTEEMKEQGYTILAPQMAPYHFELLVPIFSRFGYNVELLPSVDHGAVDAGLKYVNNDICYPSILVTGQIMEAVMSGRYDTDKLAVLITQTGGGCRATNYISLIRKALKAVGLAHIPVIAISFKDLGEHNPGFKITPKMLLQAVYALQYGDVLMQCLYRTRPYEVEPGSANRLFDHWMATCKGQLESGESYGRFKRTIRQIVGRGHQAARGRGGRDPREVPPYGEQPDRRRDRAGRVRGRGAGAHRVFPVRCCRWYFPERSARAQLEGCTWVEGGAFRHQEVPRTGEQGARRVVAFQPAGKHL